MGFEGCVWVGVMDSVIYMWFLLFIVCMVEMFFVLEIEFVVDSVMYFVE